MGEYTRISKYNQQDATLHSLFISVKCSTCFKWFLRPSSGAQKLYIQHRVLVKPLLLPAAILEEYEKAPDAVYSVFELLTMGGGTA
jgi:hypothetical protein